MARRTKTDAEITRQQLLKAGLAAFSRRGYAETRLEDVAEEAGVTRGAIYHHFGSKAELYKSLVDETMRRVQLTMMGEDSKGQLGEEQDSTARQQSPRAALRQLWLRLTTLVEEDAEYRAVVELMTFKTAVPPDLEEGMNDKAANSKKMLSVLEDLVVRGIAACEIRADVDPGDVALSLLALQNGLVMLWLMAPDSFSLRQRAERIIDLHLEGIAARS
jgi:TetR/AcrR family acrAB operon transcriptional repressor